jgi:hypothetical protein
MVLNLIIVNEMKSFPILSWPKKTVPGLKSFMSIAIAIKSGDRRRSKKHEKKKSKNRFIIIRLAS